MSKFRKFITNLYYNTIDGLSCCFQFIFCRKKDPYLLEEKENNNNNNHGFINPIYMLGKTQYDYKEFYNDEYNDVFVYKDDYDNV